MGLKEKRIIQAFQKDLFPALEEQINKAAGYTVPLHISWDTLIEDRFSHLYNDTFPKIYFLPLVEAFKAICVDDMGVKLLQSGLKEVVILNENNEHNLERAITFENGVLKIDHSPIINADNEQARLERITTLLEDKLEDLAEETSENSGSESENEDAVESRKMSIMQLHNQSLVISYEKQIIFQDIIGDLGWSCDMLEGKLTYGEDKVFNIQVLGTYSENEQSWLWGWANTQSGIPEAVLEISMKMKALGEQHQIEDLLKPKVEISTDPGHYFSTIASGILNGSCYVPLTFKGLVVYVSILSEEIDSKAISEPALICSHFAKVISSIEFSHKHGLLYYLIDKGYEVELPGNNLLAKKGENQILGLFDLKGNLMKISNSKITVES